MFKTTEELRSGIRAFKLERLEADIMRLARPAIDMIHTRVAEAVLPLGASKFGGSPDLPPGFQWPHPLSFMGQFKLSELARHDPAGLLPTQGLLYFFYEASAALWTQDPGGWKLVYVADEHTPLVRTPAAGRLLPAHRIEYAFGYTLPIIFWSEQADFGISFLYPGEDETDPANQIEHDAYFNL
ncbi:MAG TPA: DUF1963 domain-containing protein, partial [Aggregatilineaceae bacterium]|nr:DUF1963 domain-containing protein [Aggregatilineaceae bacterium]